MCNSLRALRQSIAEYRFDAACLTAAQAGEVVRLCAQIEASAASIKALAAARSAEGRDWHVEGYRSAADQLAHDAAMSPAAAKRALEVGRRMADQPEVASAALAGDLSMEQAAAVSDGVAADPAKAAELIDKAKRSCLAELNEEVAKIKAAHRDPDQARRAVHAKRSLRRWTDRDGALQAHLYGHPEDGARIWRMLDPVRRRLNIVRRESAGANETLEALDYDALMTVADAATGRDGELALAELVELGLFPQLDASVLARQPTPPPQPPSRDRVPTPTGDTTPTGDPGGAAPSATPSTSHPSDARRAKKLAGSPIRLMIRVDLDALLRGVALDGELCEIAGYGPVPVSVIEDIVATENPFIIGVLTNSDQLVGVYHHGRRPNAHQRSALDFVYPTCAVQGCASRAGLQYDHREDFARTKITAFDLLDRLCGHHHRQKTHQGWSLVPGRGKRPFVPPDDPRHPRYTRNRNPAGPPPHNHSP